MIGFEDGPSALGALLSAYAGNDAVRHRLLWALDARLGRLVATTSEAMIGAIRLAWWSEALTDGTGMKGRGEPLVDAMRAQCLAPPLGLTKWLDGWEAMLGDIDLETYAVGRGGGLFHSLAGERDVPEWLIAAGAVWALWDLSGHTNDVQLADEAIAHAQRRLHDGAPVWPAAWRPMRIAYAMARHDIIRGQRAPKALTPRLYLRLMRVALMGR